MYALENSGGLQADRWALLPQDIRSALLARRIDPATAWEAAFLRLRQAVLDEVAHGDALERRWHDEVVPIADAVEAWAEARLATDDDERLLPLLLSRLEAQIAAEGFPLSAEAAHRLCETCHASCLAELPATEPCSLTEVMEQAMKGRYRFLHQP
jgi:hypothetical protein